MRKWRLYSLALMMLGCAALFAPQSALAEPASTSAAYDGVKDTCKDIRQQIAEDDNDGIWITEYIVECVKATIVGSDKYSTVGAFEIFLLAFYPALESAIQAAVTLAVILFGVLLISGMIEKTSRDSFVFLMKLAMVVYFVQTSTVQWVFDSGVATMEDMTEMVFTFGDGGEAEGRCRVRSGDVLWDRVDCMLDVIIGIRQDVPADGIVNDNDANVPSPERSGISRGMMHFFFANMASSAMGAMVIGFLGMYTLFSFVFAVIKSLHTYLSAILALAFILLFMPMFVPMIMFKATRNYFDKWYRIAVSFILQPVILFGFLSLMMIAFDTILVSGNNSITRMIIGDAADTEVLSEALERQGVYEQKRWGEQGISLSGTGATAGRFTSNLTGASGLFSTPMGESIRDGGPVAGMVTRYRAMEGINYNKLAEVMGNASSGVGYESEEAAARAKEQLGYAAIVLAMTCFIFLSMLNYIPTMATDLAGGVFEVPNLYERVGQHFIGSNQAEVMARNASSALRGRTGDNFVGNAVRGFGDMVRGR